MSGELSSKEEKDLRASVQMAGDADEPGEKARVVHQAAEKKAEKRADSKGKSEDKTPEKKAQAASARGELSPAQHDDDGWGDTPVQMRG